MFGIGGRYTDSLADFYFLDNLIFIIFAVICSYAIFAIHEKTFSHCSRFKNQYNNYFYIVLFFVSLTYIIKGAYNPFIYSALTLLWGWCEKSRFFTWLDWHTKLPSLLKGAEKRIGVKMDNKKTQLYWKTNYSNIISPCDYVLFIILWMNSQNNNFGD